MELGLLGEAQEQVEAWAEAVDEAEWTVTGQAQVPEEVVYVLIANYPCRIERASHAIT